MVEQNGPRLLTKYEFAQYWKVSMTSVDRWIKEGRVTVIRTPGGTPRFVHPEDERNSPFTGNVRRQEASDVGTSP